MTDSIWVDHVLEEKEPLPITKRYNIAERLPKDARNLGEHPYHAGATVYNTTAAESSALAANGHDSPDSSLDTSQSDDLPPVPTLKSRATPKTSAPVSGLHPRSKSTASAKKSTPATPKSQAQATPTRVAKASSAAKSAKAKAAASHASVHSDETLSSEEPQSPSKNDKKRRRDEEEVVEPEIVAKQVGRPSKRKALTPLRASSASTSIPSKTPLASAMKGKKSATESAGAAPRSPAVSFKANPIQVVEIDDDDDAYPGDDDTHPEDDIEEEIAAITSPNKRRAAPKPRAKSAALKAYDDDYEEPQPATQDDDNGDDDLNDVSEEVAVQPRTTPNRPQRTQTVRVAPVTDSHMDVDCDAPKRRKKPLVAAASSAPRRAPKPARYVPPKYEHRIYLSGFSDEKKSSLSFKLQQLVIDHNVSIGLVDSVREASICIPHTTPTKSSNVSFNLLIAIMRGIWILEATWLDSLLKHQGKIPKREKYEVTKIPGPRAARLARKERKDYLASLDEETRRESNDDTDPDLPRLIFSDWAFNLDIWKSDKPAADQLAYVVEYGGGIVTSPWDADVWFTPSETTIPEPRFSTPSPMSSEDARTLKANPSLRKRAFTASSTKRGMPVYGFNLEWLRDSILCYEARDPAKYNNRIELFDALS